MRARKGHASGMTVPRGRREDDAASSGKLIWMSAAVEVGARKPFDFARARLPRNAMCCLSCGLIMFVIGGACDLSWRRKGRISAGARLGIRPEKSVSKQQRKHRRALGIVQPVGVAQTLRRVRRRDQAAVAVGLDDIVDDRARIWRW